MNNPPRISIIIPVYNYAHTVARAITSVSKQLMPGIPVEIIIVNDGSTDDSDRVIRELIRKTKLSIQYIDQQNKGSSGARNTGIKNASGDYLCFLDADDELAPDAIREILKTLEKNPDADVIFGDHISQGSYSRQKRHRVGVLGSDNATNFQNYFRKKISICNGATLVKRQIMQSMPYNEKIRHAEDIPVFAALLARCNCVAANFVIAVIHTHASSMRNDASAALRSGTTPVDALFAPGVLPENFQRYKSWCMGLRRLSLFRTLYKAGMYKDALAFYRGALKSSPLLLLRFSYTRKALVAFLKSRRA